MAATKVFLAGIALWFVTLPAAAVELIMVERQGCHYCIEWKESIGPAYPNTQMGQFAPLRTVDIADAPPEGVTFDSRVLFTPTFILVNDGAEIGRIEGHPGDDFFWGLLHRLLTDKAGYDGPG
jgi:hypothetical protein